MSYTNLPSNLHACCGAYWAGQTCRSCGRHFEGGGAFYSTSAGNSDILQGKSQTGTEPPAPKKRKRARKAANRCLNCGATLPAATTIAVSLICGKCQKEMLSGERNKEAEGGGSE